MSCFLHDFEHSRALTSSGLSRVGEALMKVFALPAQGCVSFLALSPGSLPSLFLHAMDRTIDRLHLRELACFQGNSNHALIDDCCRTASLRDEHFAFQFTHTAGDVSYLAPGARRQRFESEKSSPISSLRCRRELSLPFRRSLTLLLPPPIAPYVLWPLTR